MVPGSSSSARIRYSGEFRWLYALRSIDVLRGMASMGSKFFRYLDRGLTSAIARRSIAVDARCTVHSVGSEKRHIFRSEG